MKIKESIKCKTAFITAWIVQVQKNEFWPLQCADKFSTVVNLILKGLNLTVVLALIDDVLAFDQEF